MCGIYGSEYRHEMRLYLHSMRYRGPDEQGIVYRKKFSLGVARLALVDVRHPAAAQPYVSRKANVVALNGEIYNYRMLSRFYRPTEIELVAEMIDEGCDVRQYFDGDYAIVHYNPSTSMITLYRDRFGVCPLYYQTKPYVALSSESRRLRYPREVPAHGRVVIDLKKRKVIRRDIIPLYGAIGMEPDEKVLSCALRDAVTSRAMHGEGPFSVALSGGLDSSLIALALTVEGFRNFRCVTSYFSSASDDLRYARMLTDKLKLPLREVAIPKEPDPDIFHHIEGRVTSLRYQGALRSWYVAKNAETRVILCGDGGDELLGGYSSHDKVYTKSSSDYAVARKRFGSLRSMQHFNLDRTNKMGMAHSKEFRAPMLAHHFSQLALSLRYVKGKEAFRKLARYYGAPEIAERKEKYSADELSITMS